MEDVPYRLILANEDFIPFTGIRVDTRMYCKYRGTYPVGVKSVSVTDFLGLFTITYPMKSQIRLTAKLPYLMKHILKLGSMYGFTLETGEKLTDGHEEI